MLAEEVANLPAELDPARLYKSPHTDLNDQGLDGLFGGEAADALLAVLDEIKRRAAA